MTPGTAAHQACLSFTISQSLLRLIHSVDDAIQTSRPLLGFSCLQTFPASGSFPVSWLFTSGGQSIIGASVLPMNIRVDFLRTDWFDLFAVQGTLKSSPTQFKSISSLALSLLDSPTLTSVVDYTYICLQNDVFVF